MSNVNAAKLIIENIQLLEQSKKMIEDEISIKLFETVDHVIKEKIESFGEWEGDYKFLEYNSVSFAPSYWKVKDSNKFHQKFYARYSIGCENEQTDSDYNHWWLSNFLKNDVERIIFDLYPWYDNFKEKVNNKKWKEFVSEQDQLNLQIEQLGFKYNAHKGCWYLVVEGIEPEIFIENDDLADALTPITEALDKIKQAHPYFDQIVQAAIAKFGRVEVEETV
ncbi:hypothetical protein QSV37_11465 [Acinetobacter sp. VNK23]|uniref:hypothetical protein n=1 Tax=Acinetobacter thutiue TaxID=2998078 RepID=UPI002574E5DA|nr:hypothetical protein [Acinetobacter thutiue]MDM1020913.1 hypothetical protein [Acinetobacter thutiue]